MRHPSEPCPKCGEPHDPEQNCGDSPFRFQVRKVRPEEYLDMQVESGLRLYEHLRGPGHGHTEGQAVKVVLQDLATVAKRMLARREQDSGSRPVTEAHHRGLDWDNPERSGTFCGNCMNPWPCPDAPQDSGS